MPKKHFLLVIFFMALSAPAHASEIHFAWNAHISTFENLEIIHEGPRCTRARPLDFVANLPPWAKDVEYLFCEDKLAMVTIVLNSKSIRDIQDTLWSTYGPPQFVHKRNYELWWWNEYESTILTFDKARNAFVLRYTGLKEAAEPEPEPTSNALLVDSHKLLHERSDNSDTACT